MKNILFPDLEKSYIRRAILRVIPSSPQPAILDVGCGYGRNLCNLVTSGLRIVGIDANSETVAHNTTKGYECYLPDSDGWRQEYDCILMSHIIEHFSPADLIKFMEEYLAYLKIGGHLVVATPLLTDYFFDDFTHIRPYPPDSLLMVFCDENRQVSMRSEVNLELRDLWFRTSAYKVRWVRARYVGRYGKSWIKLLNGFLALTHVATFGIFGKKDGWVGIFKKVR